MEEKKTAKLWGGRFTSSTNSSLEKLNASIDVDKRMFAEDIEGSIAYTSALKAIDLLTEEECKAIQEGLQKIKLEWELQQFITKSGDEDIHTANERRLKELIGEPATKLHVGRSRNDQVITDMKLWLRKNLIEMKINIKNLVKVLNERAAREIDIFIPGYTHLQRAQPVRWSHWLLSYAWYFRNDVEKLDQLLENMNVLPLGSGALAGNPFSVDRYEIAKELGFDSVTQNSMQAVGDRDFIAEFLFWSSMVGIHLSRFAEDLILYATKEFGYVEIDETYSTGSSLMPQKRNPDSLELIRGLGGSLLGQCCTMMFSMKGLPSTYNKDLQIDKESMFNTFDKLQSILEVAAGVVETLKVNSTKCKASLSADMLATDLAYYLVRKGVAFREAHHISGQIVAEAEKRDVFLYDLTLEELKCFSDKFDADVAKVWNYENSIEQYQTVGGTSKNSVMQQIQTLETWLNK